LPFEGPPAWAFDFRSPPPSLSGVALTCNFFTLAARDIRLHTLYFLCGDPARFVDGEGPKQAVLDGLVDLSGCHSQDPAGLGDGIGTKARHAGSFLCEDEPLQLSGQREPSCRPPPQE
jgi:hypothetical protein